MSALRLATIVTVLLAAGCGVTAPAANPEPRPVERVIPAPLSQVWPALVATQQGLGFSLAMSDRESGVLQTADSRTGPGQAIGGISPVELFDCGRAVGVPVASGPLVVSVATQAQPAQGGTAVRVTVRAMSPGHRTTVDTPCGSTGRLEAAILDAVGTRAAQ